MAAEQDSNETVRRASQLVDPFSRLSEISNRMQQCVAAGTSHSMPSSPRLLPRRVPQTAHSEVRTLCSSGVSSSTNDKCFLATNALLDQPINWPERCMELHLELHRTRVQATRTRDMLREKLSELEHRVHEAENRAEEAEDKVRIMEQKLAWSQQADPNNVQIHRLEGEVEEQRQLRLHDARQVEAKAARIKEWVTNKLRELEQQNQTLREQNIKCNQQLELLRNHLALSDSRRRSESCSPEPRQHLQQQPPHHHPNANLNTHAAQQPYQLLHNSNHQHTCTTSAQKPATQSSQRANGGTGPRHRRHQSACLSNSSTFEPTINSNILINSVNYPPNSTQSSMDPLSDDLRQAVDGLSMGDRALSSSASDPDLAHDYAEIYTPSREKVSWPRAPTPPLHRFPSWEDRIYQVAADGLTLTGTTPSDLGPEQAGYQDIPAPVYATVKGRASQIRSMPFTGDSSDESSDGEANNSLHPASSAGGNADTLGSSALGAHSRSSGDTTASSPGKRTVSNSSSGSPSKSKTRGVSDTSMESGMSDDYAVPPDAQSISGTGSTTDMPTAVPVTPIFSHNNQHDTGTTIMRTASAAAVFADSGVRHKARNATAPSECSASGGVDPPLEKSGSLAKLGGKLRTWRKKWFVLRNGQLLYYKSASDAAASSTGAVRKPQGQIMLDDMCKITRAEGSNTFEIDTGKKTYYLTADSILAVEDWVRILLLAQKRHTARLLLGGGNEEIARSALLQGWLTRVKNGHAKKCWCVLIGKTLVYFKSAHDASAGVAPIGQLPLRDTRVEQVEHLSEDSDSDEQQKSGEPPPRTAVSSIDRAETMSTSGTAGGSAVPHPAPNEVTIGIFPAEPTPSSTKKHSHSHNHLQQGPIYLICRGGKQERDAWLYHLTVASGGGGMGHNGTQYEQIIHKLMEVDGDANCVLWRHPVLVHAPATKDGAMPSYLPLTTLPTDALQTEAVKLFKCLQLFMSAAVDQAGIDYHVVLAQNALQQCLDMPELQSELICALIKQTSKSAPLPKLGVQVSTQKLLKKSAGHHQAPLPGTNSTHNSMIYNNVSSAAMSTISSTIGCGKAAIISSSDGEGLVASVPNSCSTANTTTSGVVNSCNHHTSTPLTSPAFHTKEPHHSKDHKGPPAHTLLQGWQMLALAVSLFVPKSSRLLWFLKLHLQRNADNRSECGKYAAYCERALERTIRTGGRELKPSRMEVLSILLKNPQHHSLPHSMPVHLMISSTYHITSFDGSTSIKEFQETLAQEIGCRSGNNGFAIFSDDPIEKELEHTLDANAKLCDIIARWEIALREKGLGKFENSRVIKLTYKNRLWWKNSARLETDKERLLLCYQVNGQIVAGRFPLSRDLALELAALMAQLDMGDCPLTNLSSTNNHHLLTNGSQRGRPNVSTTNTPTHSRPATVSTTLTNLHNVHGILLQHSNQALQAIDRFYPYRYRDQLNTDGLAELQAKLLEKWRSLKGRTQLDCVRIYLTCTRKWPFFGATLFQARVRQPHDTPMVWLAVNEDSITVLDLATMQQKQRFPYTSVLTFGGCQDDFMLVVTEPVLPGSILHHQSEHYISSQQHHQTTTGCSQKLIFSLNKPKILELTLLIADYMNMLIQNPGTPLLGGTLGRSTMLSVNQSMISQAVAGGVTSSVTTAAVNTTNQQPDILKSMPEMTRADSKRRTHIDSGLA